MLKNNSLSKFLVFLQFSGNLINIPMSGLELRARNEMTQSAPPVEQMLANGAGHCQKVEMVTTKKENVAVLSDSFMSECSMTSSGMFYFLGQTSDRNISHFSKIVFRGNFKRR